MDDELLRKITAEIDELPRDGEARSHISIGKPESYVFVAANRQGLVSLARAFLMAALSPAGSSNPTRIEISHLQVLDSKKDVAIGWIEHADIVPIPKEIIAQRKKVVWNNDRFFLIGCALITVIIVFLIMSGLILWAGIITGSLTQSNQPLLEITST